MAGVHVPIFCSHPKLPPLGACRICVVEVGTPKLGRERQPVLAADGTARDRLDAQGADGLHDPVSEGHARADDDAGRGEGAQGRHGVPARQPSARLPGVRRGRRVPAPGSGVRVRRGASRAWTKPQAHVRQSEDLGPVVKKEANRCIVCMRCVRYCDEVMGDDALTAHQRGVRTEISSFNRQPLECEQCGNCIEVCPVGALTALPYRFKARPWDLRQHITVCPYCSNGCSVRLGVRGMEILRARGTEHRGVNGEYLCVRGRFGYDFVSERRPPFGAAAALGGARAVGLGRSGGVCRGPAARDRRTCTAPRPIAFLGRREAERRGAVPVSEAGARRAGTRTTSTRARALTAPRLGRRDSSGHGRRAPVRSVRRAGRAEEVLVLGDDLQGEAPFAQAELIRGQHQAGLHLTVAHPRRVKLARAKFGGDWLGLSAGQRSGVRGRAHAGGARPRRVRRDFPPRSQRGLVGSSAERLQSGRPSRPRRRRAVPRRPCVQRRSGCARPSARPIAVRPRDRPSIPRRRALLQAIENLGVGERGVHGRTRFGHVLGPQHE